MKLQSIVRTPIPGAPGAEADPNYREVWPELRLKMPLQMPIQRADIKVTIVDSGDPKKNDLNRDDDGHAALLERLIRTRAQRFSGVNIAVNHFKAFSAQGWPELNDSADAISQAVAINPHVIVLAWDTGHTTQKLWTEIALATNAVFVVAAGNWSLNNDRYYNWPANHGQNMTHVITVMATDEHDERASFSSYGQTSVYVAAPGFAMIEAAPSSSNLRNFGSLKQSASVFRGTSAATAHVALLAALVKAKNPSWASADIKKHIGNTARVVPALMKRWSVVTKLCAKQAIADFGQALTP